MDELCGRRPNSIRQMIDFQVQNCRRDKHMPLSWNDVNEEELTVIL